jgi:DNA invertase Pin-like site-specific DNA recombinase
MKEYAKKNDWTLADHFVDEGESAKTADRPELKNLLQYCKEHKEIDAVVVHKLDRMVRNLVDYGTIKAILKQRGIRLVSVSEPFDDNPVGHILENIIASISEWYSANLGKKSQQD